MKKITDPNTIHLLIDNLVSSTYYFCDFPKVLEQIDFNNIQGELDKTTINNLVVVIKRCIITFSDSSGFENRSDWFRLMKYSVLRHYISKITSAVSSVIKIEIPPKQTFDFYLMIQYKDIIRYYSLTHGGFKEIRPDEYERSNHKDVNTDEVLEIIPLTELEF